MADMETESEEKCRLCEDCNKAFDTQVDFEVHLCFNTRKCPLLCRGSSSEERLCKSFHCCLCGKKFDSFRILDYHKNTHTGEKPYSCPHCHFRSTTSGYLNIHIVRNHTKDFKHNCSFCSKGFVHKSELQKHIQSLHPSQETDESIVVKKEKEEAEENQKRPDQMHYCTQCTYVTNIKNNLVRHLWTHSSDRPYQCEICNMGFTQTGHLKDHLRIHTGERPFVCNTCGRGFSSKTYFRTHERLHLKEKTYLSDPSKSIIRRRINKKPTDPPVKTPCKVESFQNKPEHECVICKKTFPTNARLLVHIRVHTEKNSYECEICKKEFTTLKILAKHKRLHLLERKVVMHRCHLCPFSASREYSLRVHLQTHSVNEEEKCRQCHRVVNNMEKHLETCKGINALQCKYCSNRFPKKELMKHHAVCKEKHPFACSTCGRGFYTLSYLKFHESLHPTPLPTPPKKETPPKKKKSSFTCRTCRRVFRSDQYLKFHESLHTASLKQEKEKGTDRKEIQNPTHLLITDSTQKQTLILQKPSVVSFQPAPIQNQLIILQPTIILNGS